MPDPVSSSPNSSYFEPLEGASAAENEAQMCLISAHSLENPSAPSSLAVDALVSRFTLPRENTAIEPSLATALANCGDEALALVVKTGVAVLAAPETAMASLLVTSSLLSASVSLNRCLEADQARQVEEGTRKAQAADCEARGDVALLTSGGSVVCGAR